MIDLKDSRWKELSDARGPASEVPKLLARVRDFARQGLVESTSPDDPWKEVFSRLVHQRTLYSASYAALPFLAETARMYPAARASVLSYAGTLEVEGVPPRRGVPEWVVAEYSSALTDVRSWSKDVCLAVTKQQREYGFVPYLLQAFAGLRWPKSAVVSILRFLGDNRLEIEGRCSTCGRDLMLELRNGVRVIGREPAPPISGWHPSGENLAVARGEEILQSADPMWELVDTAGVVAALARMISEEAIGNDVLTLFAPFACPYGQHMIDPREWSTPD